MDKKAILLERNKISRLLGTETEDSNLERNIFLLKSLDRQKDIVDIIAKVYVLIKDGQDSQTFEDIKNEVRGLIGALDKYQEALGDYTEYLKIYNERAQKDFENKKALFEKYGEGKKAGFIKEHILKNFYAFELMMAPYAIGHMKMSFLLEELGHRLKDDERCKLYLTNTLDMKELEQTLKSSTASGAKPAAFSSA